ncbi:hypothetical protein K438DRAFT_1746719 [Mycena galopus ATCC 62051]|nr:hypothetical protein K438DRAFT_1746719 [Mycena galopus ATCC 62051]
MQGKNKPDILPDLVHVGSSFGYSDPCPVRHNSFVPDAAPDTQGVSSSMHTRQEHWGCRTQLVLVPISGNQLIRGMSGGPTCSSAGVGPFDMPRIGYYIGLPDMVVSEQVKLSPKRSESGTVPGHKIRLLTLRVSAEGLDLRKTLFEFFRLQCSGGLGIGELYNATWVYTDSSSDGASSDSATTQKTTTSNHHMTTFATTLTTAAQHSYPDAHMPHPPFLRWHGCHVCPGEHHNRTHHNRRPFSSSPSSRFDSGSHDGDDDCDNGETEVSCGDVEENCEEEATSTGVAVGNAATSLASDTIAGGFGTGSNAALLGFNSAFLGAFVAAT